MVKETEREKWSEVKMGPDAKAAVERLVLGGHRTKLDVEKLVKESQL